MTTWWNDPKLAKKSGYIFLPLPSSKKIEEDDYPEYFNRKEELLCRLTYDPSSETCEIADFMSYGYVVNYELKNVNVKEIKKMKEDILHFLQFDIKIHLQPKKKYLPEVLDRLRSDTDILKQVKTWKVIATYDDEKMMTQKEEDRNAIIVLYPLAKSEDELVKILLDLCELFPDSETLGLNVTPRFNKRLNSLLYIAGGDGDIKVKYKKTTLFTDDFYFYTFQEKPMKKVLSKVKPCMKE